MRKTLKVMDSSGDSAVAFDEADAKATTEARELFERLTKKGAAVFAVNRGEGHADKPVKRFEDLEAENVVVPAIVGG